MCSAQFTRDAFAEAWAKVRAQWPAHIAAAGIDSSGAGGFPAEWERGIGLLDKLAATPGSFTEYYDKCAKIWASRVQTVRARSCSFISLSDFEHTSQKRSRCVQTIHGDFNTGNVWKNKEEPSKHCVADWQGLRKGNHRH